MATPRKTPTQEQKQWMKENGYTEAQMDRFWKDNVSTNPIIRNLDNSGRTWRDMNLSCVQQLPTQKERDRQYLTEKAEREAKEKAALLDKQQKEQYYKEHFDEVMLAKINAGEKLTEKELCKLVFEYEVETNYGENRRWSRTNITIVRLKDKYFSITWEEGLTEAEPDDFPSQPFEVTPHTYEKTITVTEWIRL